MAEGEVEPGLKTESVEADQKSDVQKLYGTASKLTYQELSG